MKKQLVSILTSVAIGVTGVGQLHTNVNAETDSVEISESSSTLDDFFAEKKRQIEEQKKYIDSIIKEQGCNMLIVMKYILHIKMHLVMRHMEMLYNY